MSDAVQIQLGIQLANSGVASAPAWTAPSKSSIAHWMCSARRFAVRHEVVHNKFVVDNLRDRGAVSVDELSEVPDGTIVIFSAHGVSQAVRREAKNRGLKVFDATCPLCHQGAYGSDALQPRRQRMHPDRPQGHPEVEGTMGQYDTARGRRYLSGRGCGAGGHARGKNPDALAYVTQTTLSMDDTAQIIDALRARFPNIHGPRKDDICYAAPRTARMR